MKYVCALAFVLLSISLNAQTQRTGQAQTTGPCSPAITGANNQLTITCTGVPAEFGTQLVELMNKIATNQLDAKALMAKMDSCLAAVKAVKENQTPWNLTADQKKQLHDLLMGSKGKVVIHVIPSDRNASLMGGDILDVLSSVGWEVGQGLNSDFTLPAGMIGITIAVTHSDFPEAILLQHSLALVGLTAEGVMDKEKRRVPDEVTMYLAIGAKPQVPVPENPVK